MYDIIIIGGGPGGYVAAERAGARGKKVLLVERDSLGGTCLNRGCIPTKSLLNAAKHLKHATDSAALGVHAESVRFELAEAMAWKDQTVEKLRQGIEFRMKKHAVDVIRGSARFDGPGRIVVDGEDRSFESPHLRRSRRGMAIETGARVEAIEDGTVHYSKDGQAKTASGDLILIATGRKPEFAGLGLETAGVAFSPKGIDVDDCLRTSVPGIWAVGDATGRSLLAHSASAMGEAAVDGILGNPRPIAWNAIPWVVYGNPEAAGVGLTEEDATLRKIDYAKVTVPARSNGRFVAENGIAGNGCVKLLAEKGSGRLLGVHAVDPYAGEQIWGAQPLVAAGAAVGELRGMIFPHPTVSELLRDAAWEIVIQ
ncbi:MAG: FAD-dependent oxidoreductase [Spirochaetes bacterium]|nr:FAD-dependent oxidoreductase [Spirochaetota bacterium]